MRTGCLFSGYGGLSIAVNAYFGAETAWFSEFDTAPSKILAHHWPDVPNHGDITRIDWSSVEPVDILCGGFPCQWMMMLPDGHVTGVGLSRNEELKAIGNGVVPAQAYAALTQLVPLAAKRVQ